MDKKKRPNIYWFIIDSVRTYKTGLDDRDRIDILDEVAADGVEFTNCVTGAPSSLLSAGALFTGLPATFVARHFNEWKFTGMEISTMATLKEEYNYETHPILDTRDLREILHKLLPPLKHKELPKGYNLSDYIWHNKDVTKIFKHYLAKEDPNKNNAYIMWYDCRRDPKTNDYVKEAIDAIKEKGDFENSIIIMQSDHGYPDPSTKLNEEYFKDIGHDMILTDDNIKVPLVVKTPDGPIGKKFEHQVGLTDVLPTIFDVLGIEYKKLNTSFQGTSLVPIMNGKEDDGRIRKVDTRLPMDVRRIGCLRNNKFKYIFLYNDELEFFYDLKNDPSEMKNLVKDESYAKDLNEFRKLNDQYEDELFLFHDKQVKQNLSVSIDKINKGFNIDAPHIVIVTKGIELIIDLLVKKLKSVYPKSKISLVFIGGKKIDIKDIHKVHYIEELNKESIESLGIKDANLTIYFTENSSRVFLKRDHVEAVKSLKANRSFLMNFNFELFNYFSSKLFNATYVKLFFDWDTKGYFYRQEPLYFFKDFSVFVKYFFIKLFRALSRKKKDIDLKAAREAMHYRQSILETNQSDEYANMDKEELENEISRLNTRED